MLALLATVAVLAVVAAAAVYMFARGPVTAASLKSSVERESGSPAGLVLDEGGCRRRGAQSWRCEVVDSGSSGTAKYDVRVTDGSCWTGELAATVGEPMPERISGCVLRFVD